MKGLNSNVSIAKDIVARQLSGHKVSAFEARKVYCLLDSLERKTVSDVAPTSLTSSLRRCRTSSGAALYLPKASL